MKKKYVILIIIGIVLVIGSYLGYKTYLYFKYIPNANKIRNEYIDSLKINNKITIETTKLKKDEYLTVNKINIRNDFKNFELSDFFVNDENAEGYILKENGEIKEPKTLISLGKNIINILEIANSSEIKDNENKIILNFIEENEIKNDYDLLLNIINDKNKKINLFTSKKEMLAYYYKYTSLRLYPNFKNITLIEGDLNGFILDLKDISGKEVNLFDGVDKYVITFWNKEYFTDEYIKDLLSTVTIEK